MLFSVEHKRRLHANGLASEKTGRRGDTLPVLRVVSPDTGASWLISETRADNRDLAFALYDAGDGSIPAAGWVSLAELAYARSSRGRLLDVDWSFRPTRPLIEVYGEIRLAGRIPSRPTRH